MSKKRKLDEALRILSDLGMPNAQQNERTALCLLALVNLTPPQRWCDAQAPLIGITPIKISSEPWLTCVQISENNLLIFITESATSIG